jgi:TonB family protein
MLALAVGVLSISVVAQTAPVPPLQMVPAGSPVLQGATANTIAVPESVLHELAISEPDISARDEAPQPGTVRLMVLVSSTGTVKEAAVVQGEPELARVALAGVKNWTYRPYLVNGEPREIQSTIALEFREGVGKRAVMLGMAGGVAGSPGSSGQSNASSEGGAARLPSGVVAGRMEPPFIAPVYPPAAKAAHVQGVVVLHALISKQGTIESLHVVSGPPLLVGAALDAVKRWKYQPYLLAGVPTEVETTINVNFTFAPSKKPDAADGADAGTPPAAAPATPDPQ